MKEKTTEQEFRIDGTTIAPGVVETIVSLAAAEVPGVAGVGTAGPMSAITAAFNSGRTVPTTGIKLTVDEDKKVSVEITIQAYYGHRLVEVADNVRNAVADALKGQIGSDVSAVDIYVDALAFEE
jgi:uncharacterized alkaline shock family protein YloU